MDEQSATDLYCYREQNMNNTELHSISKPFVKPSFHEEKDKAKVRNETVDNFELSINMSLDQLVDEADITTNRAEIWSYYAYYIGNSGLSLFNFAPSQFQNLLSQSAYDAALGPGSVCSSTTIRCVLDFLGTKGRSINSIVLISNGISFALQSVLVLLLGSFADYGTWRPYILVGTSLVAWAIGFAWMGVYTADKWRTGVGLYIVGLIAYQTCLTFW